MTQLHSDKKSVRFDVDTKLPVTEPPAYTFDNKETAENTVRNGDGGDTTPPRRGILARNRGKLILFILFLILVMRVGYFTTALARRHIHVGSIHRHQHKPCPKAPRGLKSHHKQYPFQGQECNIIRESSGQINGRFDLHSCLDLSTASGSIDITVTPHPGHGPAVLRINTSAGSVRVRVDDTLIAAARASGAVDTQALNRPVNADISTSSGSITATWLVGNGGRSTFTSSAGSLNLELLTLHAGPDDPITTLKTQTSSGQQTIQVTPLLGFGGEKIASLVAEHRAVGSASIKAVYPSEWEGLVEVSSTGSGCNVVRGEDLVLDWKNERSMRAHRGTGKAEVRIVSLGSASVEFQC